MSERTSNLNLPLMSVNQSQKEVTYNEAMAIIDAAVGSGVYSLWAAHTAYTVGRKVISQSMAVGVCAIVTTAGTTAYTEPTWGTIGTTVTDGTVIYTMAKVITSMDFATSEETTAGTAADKVVSPATLKVVADTKQNTEAGKGLSTNDFTTTEKTKLSGIADNADVNVVEIVQVNGTALAVSNKAVNIDLTDYATKSDISHVYKYMGSVATYADLPTTGQEIGDTYNIVAADTTHGIKAGDNVTWNGTEWDDLGGTVDLSNYFTKAEVTAAINVALADRYTKTEVNNLLNNKVDKVTGKGLSTEDYTTAEKTKLADIEAKAEVNPNFATETEAINGKSTDTIISPATMKAAINTVFTVVDGELTDNFTSWNKLKVLARNGIAEKAIPVGSQIIVPWTDKEANVTYSVPLDVVHYGDAMRKNGEIFKGMFLQWHYATPFGVQFDNREAFFYASTILPAGTYNLNIGITWGSRIVSGKIYQFTLTQDVPAGGQISIGNDWYSTDPASWTVTTWATKAATTVTETAAVTEGSEGTNLGTFKFGGDGAINCMQRSIYGYNRWAQSGQRQWLNSNKTKNAWWTAQNDFDRYPNELLTKQGFLSGFDDTFVAAMEEVKVTTVLNTITDSSVGTTEDTYDKIFTPSLQQEFIAPQLADVEGESWKYWKEASGRTSYAPYYTSMPEYVIYGIENKLSPQTCRLRSAYRGGSYDTWYQDSTGYVASTYAISANRCAPACVI